MKFITIVSLFFLCLFGCAPDSGGPRQPISLADQLPYSHGRVNNILVIADSTLWDGPAGDTFFYYFAGPYILLPQPEPIMDIQHMTPQELAEKPAKKEFKTILFLADMTDKNSLTTQLIKADLGTAKIEEVRRDKGYSTIVGQNKWARDQKLFYLIGFSEDKLTKNIAANFPPIARRIHEQDMVTIEANTYQSGVNADLQADVEASYRVEMKIPGDFKKILHNTTTNTLWLRSDDRDIVANLLIHRRPYTDRSQLSYEGVKAIRNEIGKMISTQQPNSYMRINDVDLPLFVENKTINEHYGIQARGIWDIVNDFKGGPFISNLILDEKHSELVMIDGFIFAPSKNKKRDYMQEIELIVSSATPKG